jgi:hypothetical protein
LCCVGGRFFSQTQFTRYGSTPSSQYSKVLSSKSSQKHVGAADVAGVAEGSKDTDGYLEDIEETDGDLEGIEEFIE